MRHRNSDNSPELETQGILLGDDQLDHSDFNVRLCLKHATKIERSKAGDLQLSVRRHVITDGRKTLNSQIDEV